MDGELALTNEKNITVDPLVEEALNLVFAKNADSPKSEILSQCADRSDLFKDTVSGICKARDKFGHKTKQSCLNLLNSI